MLLLHNVFKVLQKRSVPSMLLHQRVKYLNPMQCLAATAHLPTTYIPYWGVACISIPHITWSNGVFYPFPMVVRCICLRRAMVRIRASDIVHTMASMIQHMIHDRYMAMARITGGKKLVKTSHRGNQISSSGGGDPNIIRIFVFRSILIHCMIGRHGDEGCPIDSRFGLFLNTRMVIYGLL